MSKQTIALLLSGTDYGRSGLGTYVRSVVPCLRSREDIDGVKFRLMGTQADLDAYPELTSEAQTLIIPTRYKRAPISALWHLTQGQKFLRRADVSLALCLAGNRRLIARGKIPSVAVVHDLAQLHMPDKYDRMRMLYFQKFILRGLEKQSRLVAISQATRRDLSVALNLDETDIRVVYNGVDASVFARDQASEVNVQQAVQRAFYKAKGVPALESVRKIARQPYFYYPARFEHPSKNHFRLLEAFSTSGLNKSHQLFLSGADWGAEEELKKYARELRLDDSVHFCGFLPKEDVPLLIQGAQAVVMAGLHEGFGLPALEALAAGVPSCVAAAGALPEVVGHLGVQFNPQQTESIAAALKQVANDNAIGELAQQEGPLWAAGFSWQQTAKELVQECRSALGA